MAEYLNNAKSFITEKSGSLIDSAKGGNPLALAFGVILSVILLFYVYHYTMKGIRNLNYFRRGSPYIVKDTKDAKKRVVLGQNPKTDGHVNLPRSNNESGGIEFSYSCWLYIDDFSYKLGQWKHVFHKGNESSWPLRAPGVWLHPNKNALRVYMNSYNEISEYLDIENIPINKWFSLTLVLRSQNMDIYINGNLKKALKLSGIPKQNYGELYVNSFGGFSGFISKLRYYDWALNYSEIDAIQKIGPSLRVEASSVKDNERPPYLTPNWWTNE